MRQSNTGQRLRPIRVLSTLLLVGGCLTACQTQPVVQRRYETRVPDTGNRCTSRELVTIAAYTLPPPTSAKAPPFTQLDKGVQTALVSAGVKEKGVIPRILQELGMAPPKRPPTGTTILQKRIVIDVRKNLNHLREADRIASYRINLDLQLGGQDTGVRFLGINRNESTVETQDWGKVTHVDQREAKVSGEVGTPDGAPVVAKLTGEGRQTKTLTEELQVKLQFNMQSVGVENDRKRAYLSRFGRFGFDVSGNNAIDVTLKLPTTPVNIHDFTLPKGELANEPAKLTYKVHRIEIPALNGPVRCSLGGVYVARVAAANHNTVLEGDDQAEFIKGSATDRTIVLMDEDEVASAKQRWVLRTGSDLGAGTAISVKRRGRKSAILFFGDFASADAFVNWLVDMMASRKITDDVPTLAGSLELGVSGLEVRPDGSNQTWTRLKSSEALHVDLFGAKRREPPKRREK